jgi:citrate lyase subunit beta / citryl-CoA lyase
MRSLLFVPADGGRKLDKAMASGADAVIVDLEDSIAPERKAAARSYAADFLKEAVTAVNRPRLLVRVNGLQTGLTDADLDAVVPARPDAIMLPKAEGGPAIAHADAKLAAREAIGGLPDGHIKIVAIATETATSLFLAGTYGGASARLEGLTWGAEDLSADLGAETNRDGDGRFLDPYRLARALCLAGAAAAQVQAIDTIAADFRNLELLRRETEEARHQRGVHADGGAGRQGPNRDRRVRQQSRQGRGRHRRGDVRPPAPRTRQAVAGARKRGGRDVGAPYSPYTFFGSNVLSPSRNSSITAPALLSGTAR